MYYFIKILMKLALHAYHKKIEVHGLENVPKDKPVLFLPNHQSALLDVLLIVVACNRKPFFLTRSDVFGKPLLDAIFRYFRMIPIYRLRDGKDKLSKNDMIFDACADVLRDKEALVMFPEANHNLKRRVRLLSKGFTRILFRAKNKYPDLDIHLVPVGLNYKDATNFPDEVAIYYGKSFPLNAHYDSEDIIVSTNRVKTLVSDCLKELTTHVASETGYDKVIRFLDEAGADYLRPREVNTMISNYAAANSKIRLKKPKRKSVAVQTVLVLLNAPVVLLWKGIMKPKVWEPEFTGTLRFATAIIGFSIYYTLLFTVLYFYSGLAIALGIVVALFICNWILVKYLSPF
jgi:1-acyl-sn-glycerol-3-phosphate acyltransferase